MNVLPTSPDRTATKEEITRHFEDMKRWNFDVAYTAFYAFPMAELKGPFQKPYQDFARTAHENGCPACVQIQSTVGFLDDVGIENSQYYTDNTAFLYQHYKRYGKKNFFGSFAAPGWLRYIQSITEILRSYGFDWVVFEEPMFRTDIPGTKDKLYERFQKEWPGLDYPSRQDESVAYIRLQELKSRVLEEFYATLCAFARKVGFEKIGIVPWFFVPTFENTPMETWNTCCHIGKLTFLEDLDFIVVRMQPDNVYAEATIASGGESIPQISHLESLAHNLGKPIISVNNPTNEHIIQSADTSYNLLPYDFFARFTLAAVAAAPHGMTRHWYGKDYGRDEKHMELMTKTNPYLTRLGSPVSSVAVVFSYDAMNRTVPRPWTETWKSYWFIAHRLLYRERFPVLTFFDGTLAESLKRHPETKVLIFNEYFPLSEREIKLVEGWLESDPEHRLLYLGARNGYRHQPDALYHSFQHRPPELLRLFGCDTDHPIRTFSPGELIRLEYTPKNAQLAFLGEFPEIRCCSLGIPRLNPDANLEILYSSPQTDSRLSPVIFRNRTKSGGYALFVGLSTDGTDNDLPLRRIIDFLLEDDENNNAKRLLVERATPGILWNRTANHFVIVCNCYDQPGRYDLLCRDECLVWDLKNRAFVSLRRDIPLSPLDFHVFRIVEEHNRLLDVEGQICLYCVKEETNSIRISGYFTRSLTITLLEPPSRTLLGQKELTYTLNQEGKICTITVDVEDKGDAEITLLFG